MKNTVFTTLLIVLLVAAGCQREASVQEVMEDDAKRAEVYSTIMDNPEMRNEMRDAMQKHPQGGQMMHDQGMMGHQGMMGDTSMMMGDTTRMGGMSRQNMRSMMQQMMAACAADSANCNQMAQMMMQHHQMMQGMMMQMRQKGMMDESCYQQMMQNMGKANK